VQSIEMLRAMGHEVFGVSDGYPNPVQEYYLIKRLKPA